MKCKVDYLQAADIDLGAAKETARLCASHAGKARPVQCDVADDAAQEALFAEHLRLHGGIDVAVLNAGIYERGSSPSFLNTCMFLTCRTPSLCLKKTAKSEFSHCC